MQNLAVVFFERDLNAIRACISGGCADDGIVCGQDRQKPALRATGSSNFPFCNLEQSVMTSIELFFENHQLQPSVAGEAWTDPRVPGRTGRKYGTLYHLRRNIDHCFGNLIPNSEVPAPWPGALCIMTGIDLLSILFSGESNNPRIAQDQPERWKYTNEGRFTQYIKEFFPESEKQHADRLWTLRNTLMHSFGIYSRTQRTKFILTADPSAETLLAMVPPQNQNLFSVDLCRLKISFEHSIGTYRSTLTAANQDALAKFEGKFEDFGWLVVSPSPANPSSSQFLPFPPLTLNVHSVGLPVTNQSMSTICRAASGQQF